MGVERGNARQRTGSVSDPDAALVARVRDNNDSHAFALLVQRHGNHWMGQCASMFSDQADRWDAFQDATLAIWKGIKHFRGDAKFSTWSYTVVRNSVLRTRTRANHAPKLFGEVEETEDVTTRHAVLVPDFADSLLEKSDLSVFTRRLKPEIWQTLKMCADGYTYEETAEKMGCAVGTVGSRISRVRKDYKLFCKTLCTTDAPYDLLIAGESVPWVEPPTVIAGLATRTSFLPSAQVEDPDEEIRTWVSEVVLRVEVDRADNGTVLRCFGRLSTDFDNLERFTAAYETCRADTDNPVTIDLTRVDVLWFVPEVREVLSQFRFARDVRMVGRPVRWR